MRTRRSRLNVERRRESTHNANPDRRQCFEPFSLSDRDLMDDPVSWQVLDATPDVHVMTRNAFARSCVSSRKLMCASAFLACESENTIST